MINLKPIVLAGLAISASAIIMPTTAAAQSDTDVDDPDFQQPQPTRTRSAAPVAAPATARPEGMSIGLGLSYALGAAELHRPDGASARFRMDGGLTLEPFVRLETRSQSVMDGDVKNGQNEFAVGSNLRLPLAGRGKVDFIAQIGAGLNYIGDDPDGDDNNSGNFRFAIDYGLGVEYWVNHNWCISFTARNPFLSYESRTQEVSSDVTETDTEIGIIWDPGIDAALHLFY